MTPEIKRLIDELVKDGAYASPEQVMLAALHALKRDSQSGDFAPGELERLLAESERSGASLDGNEVLAEIRDLRNGPEPKSKAG